MALFLMLATVFTLASCLPEIEGKSSSKKDSAEEEADTKAKTTEIEGIESRLEELERQYMLTFQRMTQEERRECVDWLQNDLYVNLTGDLTKGYLVEQNANVANVLLFAKSADAKAVESALINSVAGAAHIQVARKNSVVVYGDGSLVDLILNTKTSSQTPSKETTGGYYGEQTNGSYEYDSSYKPDYTYEPGVTVGPSYTTTDENGNIIIIRPFSTDENGNIVKPSYSFEVVYPSISGELAETAVPNYPYETDYPYYTNDIEYPTDAWESNNGDFWITNDNWATEDPTDPSVPDVNDGYDMWMVQKNWKKLLEVGKLTFVKDWTAEMAPLYHASLIEWGADLMGDLISVHEAAYEFESTSNALIFEFSSVEDADSARAVLIEKSREEDPYFDSSWIPQYGNVVFLGQSDWVYYLVP